jgi:hypothetical protein
MFRIAILLFGLLALSASAQDTSSPASSGDGVPADWLRELTPASACAGCYGPSSSNTDSVKRAAAAAIQQANSGKKFKNALKKIKLSTPIKLDKISSAQTQVVAGTNYDLVLKVRNLPHGAMQHHHNYIRTANSGPDQSGPTHVQGIDMGPATHSK